MMLKEKYDQQAEARFWSRRDQHSRALEELKKNYRIQDVESAARIAFRQTLINSNDGLAFERIIGKDDLFEVNYLDLGSQAARSVGRIQVRDITGRMLGYGTGFMVSPDLMLTNHHVLESSGMARRSLVDFNYEDDLDFNPKSIKTFGLEPDRFFYTSPDMDFSLVAVQAVNADGVRVSDYGFLPLVGCSGKALIGEYVSIIQHPDGGSKKVSLRENQIIPMDDHQNFFIQYHTDTAPGSSGSPVFNDQWDVVALHHAGVKKKDDEGRVLAIDGSIWTPSMGESRIAWLANEGVRVSCIIQDLREKGDWTADEKTLLQPLLLAESQPDKRISAPAVPQVEVEELALSWYADCQGYVPDFLGPQVDLPRLGERLLADVVRIKDSDLFELKYVHFSVVMSKSRRLAYYTVVNIDGATAVNIDRGGDKWYFDPRIPSEYQYGPRLYSDNVLDRGHLVRRLDPVWGSNASKANEATFHFTNCSPQHKRLNQQTWQSLENYILDNAKQRRIKVTVFTGPVFREDDRIYRGEFRIPAEFWKVVVTSADRNDGVAAAAYLQTQKNMLDEDLEFAYGDFKTYRVPVAQIEDLTGLDFGPVRDGAPTSSREKTGGPGRSIRLIQSVSDLQL